MKSGLQVLFSIHLLVISSFLFSQSARPAVSKQPAWISQMKIDYNKHGLDKYATDGYIDISFEQQVALTDKSEYYRQSRKIISQAGVQNGSQISVSFDPAYQQLIFHSVRIIRDGETLNRLDLAKIKTVHQEKELDNFIYNGSLDAILILDDVRKGDILEYSYTLKGFNPIFKNKYCEDFTLEFGVPIYAVYYKLIVPKERKLTIKNLNDTIQPVISTAGNAQVYEWNKKDIKPHILQDYTPSWYDPYAKILVSEYHNWKEVNDWATELFPVKKVLSPALQKEISKIEKENTGEDERTAAALRFVQDDIRYMGIELGENSHKPADPSIVFAQRFGDCKENHTCFAAC